MSKQKTLIVDDTSGENSDKILKKIAECFDKANDKTFSIIEDFISSGYIENLAKILIYLPEARRKSALQKLPKEVQEKVSALLDSYSQKKNCDADVLSAVGFVLKKSGFYGAKAAREVLGEKDAVFMNIMQEKSKDLFSVNPLLSMNLEYYLVNLEILLEIDDRSIQKFLREISSDELAKALKGASEDVQDKIFRNMSKRAAAMLQEDMEYMGPIRKSDVLESQKKVIEILRSLEEKGVIVISSFYAINSNEMVV